MLSPLKFRPGIYKEASDSATGDLQAWRDGNRVRFWKGQPQPIGGWTQQNTTNSIVGVVRGITDWTSLAGTKYVGLGTHLKLYVLNSGTYYDITPIRASGNLGNNPFTTTSASSLVSVAHTTHGVTEGTYVRFANSTTVNGVDMDNAAGNSPDGWEVITVTDANNFIVETGQAASGSGAGGGTTPPTFSYDINIGSTSYTTGVGWGTGPWGNGFWGTARTTSSLLLYPRTWSLSTWGEDLIANPRGDNIYYWDTSAGTGGRAAVLANAPTGVAFTVVSPQARHIIAFGDSTDSMFIQWCSQNASTTWTATETNTAGDVRLDQGSLILSAIITSSGEIAVFTDDALYTMQYIGAPLVFSTKLVGTGVGIIGPLTRATWADKVYYMGQNNFFVYDGRVQVLKCDVQSHVYDDINLDHRDKFFAVINREFQEVMFFYVSEAGTEIDRYASMNFLDGSWNIGELDRTAWGDISEIFQEPYAFDASGNLYIQEDTSAPPTGVFLESGALQLGMGDQLIFSDKLIPDFERNTGTVYVTVKARQYPAETEVSKGPYPLTSTTNKVNYRLRGRQQKIYLSSDNVDWRLSSMRMNTKPDGKQ